MKITMPSGLEGQRIAANNIFRQPDDPILTILKAHQVIEACLNTILEQALPNPEAMKESRLSFKDTLNLVRALQENDESDWMWKLISELNSVRNYIAHTLEPKDIELRLEKLVKMSEPGISTNEGPGIERFGIEKIQVMFLILYKLLTYKFQADTSIADHATIST